MPRPAIFEAARGPQTSRSSTIIGASSTVAAVQQQLADPPMIGNAVAAASAASPLANPVLNARSPIRWRGVLTSVYLGGAGLCVLFLLVGRLRLRWIESAARCERSDDVPPQVRLLISPRASRPFCCGIVSPRIVLPPAVADSEHRPHVLRHELVHVQRGDALTRAVMNVAMPVLYINPFYWLLRRSAIMASEHVADATAAESTSVVAYSRGMIDLARTLHAPPSILSVVGGWTSQTTLTKRLHWLLQNDRGSSPCNATWSCATGFFAVAVMGFVTFLFGCAPETARRGEVEAVGDSTAGCIWSMTPEMPGSAARISDCDVKVVRGQVMDDGMPVADAEVWASGYGLIGGRERVLTDREGRFELKLPIDPRMAIRSWNIVAFEGNRFGRSGKVSDDGEVSISLKPGRMANFAVRDRASGEMISGARLFLVDGRIVDAPDGQCRIGGLPKDLTKLIVVAPGFARRAIEVDLFSENQERLVVKLDKGGRILGRVVDRGGQPVAGNPVGLMIGHQSLQPAMRQITDQDGNYSMDGMPIDRPVRVSTYSHKTSGGSQWETQTVTVRAADPVEVNFSVDGDHAAPQEAGSAVFHSLASDRPDPGRGGVRGQVLLPNGEPATEFELSFQWPRDWQPGEEIVSGGPVGNACLFTPADGRFEFTGLKKGGTYRFVAAAPGYQDAVVSRVHAVALSELDSTESINLQLKPATDAVITVNDPASQPIAGADVWLIPGDPKRPLDAHPLVRRRLHGKSDSQGHVRFSAIPFADGVLIVEKDGKGTEQIAWNGTSTTVTLSSPANLKVQLSRPDGSAEPVNIFLQRVGSNRLSAKTAKAGEMEVVVENITSAKYKVSIESDDYLLSDGNWEAEIGMVKPGSMQVVTLQLRHREN
ncbi:M56 family metallopeptidase [Stieleria neptunia]|nr:M56 family metallopeptidase [Stieleria neptunia]